jgi:hypothetical protein
MLQSPEFVDGARSATLIVERTIREVTGPAVAKLAHQYLTVVGVSYFCESATNLLAGSPRSQACMLPGHVAA